MSLNQMVKKRVAELAAVVNLEHQVENVTLFVHLRGQIQGVHRVSVGVSKFCDRYQWKFVTT